MMFVNDNDNIDNADHYISLMSTQENQKPHDIFHVLPDPFSTPNSSPGAVANVGPGAMAC